MVEEGRGRSRDETIFEISTDKVDSEVQAVGAGVLVESWWPKGGRCRERGGGQAETVLRLRRGIAAAPRQERPPVESTPPPSSERHPHAATRSNAAPAVAAGSLEERLRTKSSPLVRRMAAEHGIDIASLSGSGIAGRVTRRDLVVFVESGGAATAPRPSMYAPAGFDYQPPAVTPWPGDQVEPMSKIRRLTAGHMSYSKHTSAHVTTVFEVDLTRVARLRDRLKPQYEAIGDKITYLPFVIRAVIAGLKEYPVLNAAVRGTDIILRKQYHVGIAVALDWGLIVPVIRDADNLSLAGLTRAVNDLAQRARAKKLRTEEVQDATFTITNPGVFGSIMGTPVIPQPTVAILGTGAIEKRPKVVKGPDGDDLVAIRTCAHFFLSFDHRVVDGADADRFLGFVKQQLETIKDAVA